MNPDPKFADIVGLHIIVTYAKARAEGPTPFVPFFLFFPTKVDVEHLVEDAAPGPMDPSAPIDSKLYWSQHNIKTGVIHKKTGDTHIRVINKFDKLMSNGVRSVVCCLTVDGAQKCQLPLSSYNALEYKAVECCMTNVAIAFADGLVDLDGLWSKRDELCAQAGLPVPGKRPAAKPAKRVAKRPAMEGAGTPSGKRPPQQVAAPMTDPSGSEAEIPRPQISEAAVPTPRASEAAIPTQPAPDQTPRTPIQRPARAPATLGDPEPSMLDSLTRLVDFM